jgi:hypothetical protein
VVHEPGIALNWPGTGLTADLAPVRVRRPSAVISEALLRGNWSLFESVLDFLASLLEVALRLLARPSASRSVSSVAWPAFFLMLPLTSVTLLTALFSAPMMKSLRLEAV